jgi:hypothetical protein
MANSANSNAVTALERNLASAKQNGAYQNVDYRVCELQEWSVEPTNLEKKEEGGDLPFETSSSDDMPWD